MPNRGWSPRITGLVVSLYSLSPAPVGARQATPPPDPVVSAFVVHTLQAMRDWRRSHAARNIFEGSLVL